MPAAASWLLPEEWENSETTAMIAGNIAGKTRTLPLAVYSAVSAGDMDTAMFYVGIILGISFLVVLLMNYFTGKRKRDRIMSLFVDIEKNLKALP